MKVAELDSRLVRMVALQLLKANPSGVKTTEVANEARVAEMHRDLIATNATTYHSLVGKILSGFSRVAPVKDSPGTGRDMLWRLA